MHHLALGAPAKMDVRADLLPRLDSGAASPRERREQRATTGRGRNIAAKGHITVPNIAGNIGAFPAHRKCTHCGTAAAAAVSFRYDERRKRKTRVQPQGRPARPLHTSFSGVKCATVEALRDYVKEKRKKTWRQRGHIPLHPSPHVPRPGSRFKKLRRQPPQRLPRSLIRGLKRAPCPGPLHPSVSGENSLSSCSGSEAEIAAPPEMPQPSPSVARRPLSVCPPARERGRFLWDHTRASKDRHIYRARQTGCKKLIMLAVALRGQRGRAPPPSPSRGQSPARLGEGGTFGWTPPPGPAPSLAGEPAG